MNSETRLQFPSTLLALSVAVAVLVAASVWHINVFRFPDFYFIGIDSAEVGEVLFAFLLVVPALLNDLAAARRLKHQADLQLERQLAGATARRLAAIVESSEDAIVGQDLNGFVTSWNRGAEKIYGYTAAEMVGTTVSTLIPKDRLSEESAILAKILRGESTDHFETLRRTKDGRLIDLSITASPITNEDGQVIGVSKVARDISQKKLAEKLVRDSETRLELALQRSQTGGWDYDPIDQTVHRTLQHDRIFGYESLQPKWSFRIFLDHVVPEDRPRVDRLIREAARTQSDYAYECRIRRVDGEVRWIWAAGGHERDGDGPVRRIAGILQDITERKEALEALRRTEERMRFALGAADIGIWDMDFRTGVLSWSEANEAHYGLPPGTFAGTLDAFVERVHPDDRPALQEAVLKATQDGADFVTTHRAVWPNGTVRWISGAGRIVLHDNGDPVRGVGISMDVTERHALEAQYQQAQKMEAIGQLAGGVAHDFNNLLTAILGYCELLLMEMGPDSSGRQFLEEIQKAGIKAARLTRQLLAFSRKEIIQPTLLDLNVVVSELTPMLSRLIREDVKVVLELRSLLALTMADRGQVEQVVMNLAVNARDAMPGGGTLTIEVANVELDEHYASTHFAAKPGHYVALTVSDTGVGMTPEIQAHLFEPYFTTKEVGKGTGLGLATVHGIVNRNGGSVGVYSEVGRGTCFNVYWPRADAKTVAMAAPAAASFPRGQMETVLVVEDGSQLRELARLLLEQQGYKVLVAANAEEAREIFERSAVDVLLTDVVMPGSSGPELTQQLLAQRPDLRVVYMSGYTEDAIVQHGVLKPGIAFLHKPFTSEALGQKLREALERQAPEPPTTGNGPGS